MLMHHRRHHGTCATFGTLLAIASQTATGAVETPVATTFALSRETAEEVMFAFAADLPGTDQRLGMYVRCDRAEKRLSAGLFFGAFPAGKPVQAAVRTPDGTVERFGPVVTGGSRSGHHSPELTDTGEVRRLLASALGEGVLLTNGHNSVWNRIPAAENRRARETLEHCAQQ